MRLCSHTHTQSAILFQVYGLTLRLINPAEAARAKSGHAHDDGRASSHAQASTSGSAQQVATQSTANSIPSATEGFIAGCAAGLGQVRQAHQHPSLALYMQNNVHLWCNWIRAAASFHRDASSAYLA